MSWSCVVEDVHTISVEHLSAGQLFAKGELNHVDWTQYIDYLVESLSRIVCWDVPEIIGLYNE